MDKMMENAEAARAIIALKHPGKPKETIQSEMDCPICKTGTLDYCISSINGHISASCTTDECVNFME